MKARLYDSKMGAISLIGRFERRQDLGVGHVDAGGALV